MKLKGKKIVITRDVDGCRDFSLKILERGGIPVIFPTIEIVENFSEDSLFLDILDTFDIFIFSSRNGVRFFLKKVSKDFLKGKTIFAVGDKTGDELKRYGISPIISQGKFTGSSLSEEILKTTSIEGKKILIPTSNIAIRKNYSILEKAGAEVFFWSVYLNRVPEVDEDKIKDVLSSHFITFFSPSAVSNFFKIISPEVFKRGKYIIVSIGPTTSSKILSSGIEHFIQAKVYNSDGVIRAIEESVSF